MSDKMATWLNEEIKQRGWSLRETARRMEVSHTTVVNLANEKIIPSPNLCNKLARVFGVPREHVFRLAGLLPTIVIANDDGRKQEIAEYWPYLHNEDRDTLAILAKTLYERRAEYRVGTTNEDT